MKKGIALFLVFILMINMTGCMKLLSMVHGSSQKQKSVSSTVSKAKDPSTASAVSSSNSTSSASSEKVSPLDDIVGAWINTGDQVYLFTHYSDNAGGHYLCDFMTNGSMYMSENCLLDTVSDTIVKITILAEDRNLHTESNFTLIFNFKDINNVELSYPGSADIVPLKRFDTNLADTMLNLQ